jgi:hypothetical protein
MMLFRFAFGVKHVEHDFMSHDFTTATALIYFTLALAAV